MNIQWMKREQLIDTVKESILPADTVLDIGCGIVPQTYVIPKIHICCEPYDEYIINLQEKIDKQNENDRDWIFLKMGWQGVNDHFLEKSVDAVILVDVIEHLDKKEALQLLSVTENIAKKQVIIFTPLGFMPQCHPDGIDAWGLKGGEWQEHKSGWSFEDFSGEDWKFYASKEFHFYDNQGKALDKPFGAFWAIKTYPEKNKCSVVSSVVNKIKTKFRTKPL